MEDAEPGASVSGLEEALAADREGNHLEAADLYERELVRQPDTLSVWIHATLLYWRSLDFQYLSRHGVSRAFMMRARARHLELATQLPGAFPGEPLADFWSRYIRLMAGEVRFRPEEAAALISESDPEHLEPVILGSAALSSRLQRAACSSLIVHHRGSVTARARYVTSMAEQILDRVDALEKLN